MKRRAAFLLLVCVLAGVPAGGQSLAEVVEAIERARVVTRILYVTAHPDDESSSVLTYLARSLSADVALLSITRGEGGQNALGPEQGPPLGVLRTEELLAATRHYGVRLYFTRAPDSGYSKSPEETLAVWGDTALDDMVRVIRSFRPQLIINHWAGVHSGHGQHQVAGILTPRAYAITADPKAFPQQFAEGLEPWRATQLLQVSRSEIPGGYRVPSEQISPVWGKSYNELGREGFLQHRTQGIAAFLDSPFLRRPLYLVPAEGRRLDPALLAEPLVCLARRLPMLDGLLRPALERADQSLLLARQAALEFNWGKSLRELARAGSQVAELKSQVAARPAEGVRDALWELERVRERIDAAIALVAALRLEVRADRRELVAGESFSVRVEWRRRADVPCEIQKASLALPAGWSITKQEPDPAGGVRFAVVVPSDARPLASPGDLLEPWPPPLVRARLDAVVDGYAFEANAPATAIRATSTRVETLPLVLVPAVTLTLEPRQFVLRTNVPPKSLELLARLHHYGTTSAEITAGLETPPGWRVASPERLNFSGVGDQLVRFVVTPPAKLAAGAYELNAYARRDGLVFRTSLDPLPTLPARLWSQPARSAVHVFDVAVPQNLRVGYVAAENDPIPEALRQLGIHVELLDEVALAFSDLSRFDAIAVGIRAYELRRDLARANPRLLDYAAAGGTLVVQYQRENVWDVLKPAPYMAAMHAPAVPPTSDRVPAAVRNENLPERNAFRVSPSRITDENSPVRFVVPGHPVLNFPNKISLQDFQGWVQERGLYFWSQFDPRYQPILGLRDPGEEETLGGLLYARYAQGVYIYTGLSFFRQLPEGVPGSYRLFVNLLSQSKASSPAR